MGESRLTIGELAERVGIGAKTLRYFEQVGLLPEPERSSGGYRLYSELDVRRAELVRRAKALDMGLAEIQELVEFAGTGSCSDFQGRFLKVVQQRKTEVDRRISDLEQLRGDLHRLERHFVGATGEANPDHTVLECSLSTCTCLGSPSAGMELVADDRGGMQMAEKAVVELKVIDADQDCGCGCGGAECGAAHTPAAVATASPSRQDTRSEIETCDCGCDCC